MKWYLNVKWKSASLGKIIHENFHHSRKKNLSETKLIVSRINANSSLIVTGKYKNK